MRLEKVAGDICDHFAVENLMEDDLPGRKTVMKSFVAMLRKKSSLALYKDFYKQIEKPELLVMPGKKTLEWIEVYPFLYVHGAFEGLKTGKIIKHLVIDETQDYTPVQYAVINLLFSCGKTILGDFCQRLNSNHLHCLEDFREIYQGAEFVELIQSYWSTYEIMEFARKTDDFCKTTWRCA